MLLANNELANNERVKPVVLREAIVDEVTPHTGTLSFQCKDAQQLAAVERHLTARLVSSLTNLDEGGGRVYVRAGGPVEQGGTFPRRVVIEVDFGEHPGPAIIGGA